MAVLNVETVEGQVDRTQHSRRRNPEYAQCASLNVDLVFEAAHAAAEAAFHVVPHPLNHA
jgi:hypothetical protein